MAVPSATGRAQETPASAEGSVVTYDQTYFGQYNAITAEDLLEIIPGIQDLVREAINQAGGGNNSRRGFGSSGDQILINGRRLSGKSNSIGSALQRIQASQVLRVEVIRGSVPGLDVRSEGTIINVVLTQALVSGAGSWEGTVSHYSGKGYMPGAKLSYSGSVGALDYILGATATPRYDRRERTERIFPAANPPFQGTPSFHGTADMKTSATDLTATSGLTYAFTNGDRLNFNGRYADLGQIETDTIDQYAVAVPADVYRGNSSTRRDFGNINWELGSDYEHAFANGDTFKALMLYNNTSQRDERTFRHTPPGGTESLDRLQLQLPDHTEKIARASYRHGLSDTQWLEAGGEAAINTLDQKVQLFVDTGTGGGLKELALFNPDARIEENRFETFTTFTWQPRSTFQIEGAADTEYSKLRQRGRDVNRSRSFFFLRPRLDVRYDMTPLTQFRGRVERTISQLDFTDFVSGFSVDDKTTDVVKAGNPELVPEKTWGYQVTYEHRLPNDQGVAALSVFYNDISDHIEFVPVGGTVTATVATTGNTGNAQSYGVEISTGFRLGWIGLDNASVDSKLTLRKSAANDAFTGRRREIPNLSWYSFNLNYRQDTNWHGFAYGFTLNGGNTNHVYDIDFYHNVQGMPDMDAFAEARPLGGITLRLDVKRMFKSGFTRRRFVYFGNRGLNMLKQTEKRHAATPREIRLSLRGTF